MQYRFFATVTLAAIHAAEKNLVYGFVDEEEQFNRLAQYDGGNTFAE